MKTLAAVVSIVLLIACNPTPVNTNIEDKANAEVDTLHWGDKVLPADSIRAVMNNLKDTVMVEFTGIYKPIDSIPQEDTVYIKKFLLERGFEQTAWGRGNWQYGPRIFSLTYEKGDSIVQVHKLYYATKDGKMKVNEAVNLGEE